MYALIWLVFAQILFVLYSPLGSDLYTIVAHAPLGIVIFVLAFYISGKVQASACPERIKRTTKTTRNFALVQGVVGVIYAAAIGSQISDTYLWIISFVHVAIALTIISQASSTATGYDMWEEKEFQGTLPPSASGKAQP
jgi:hypothetical protein